MTPVPTLRVHVGLHKEDKAVAKAATKLAVTSRKVTKMLKLQHKKTCPKQQYVAQRRCSTRAPMSPS